MALNICPLCKKENVKVSRLTVANKVKNHFSRHLKSIEYCFCQNPDCDVVYYNNENDELFFQRDMEEPAK